MKATKNLNIVEAANRFFEDSCKVNGEEERALFMQKIDAFVAVLDAEEEKVFQKNFSEKIAIALKKQDEMVKILKIATASMDEKQMNAFLEKYQ